MGKQYSVVQHDGLLQATPQVAAETEVAAVGIVTGLLRAGIDTEDSIALQ